MAVSAGEYDKLKARADKATADAAKAEGAMERALTQLKDDFDCDTVEDAEVLLKELQQRQHLITHTLTALTSPSSEASYFHTRIRLIFPGIGELISSSLSSQFNTIMP